ncbi:site-specific DNA-methyltransferase [bacterium]|nr:site-specific DNA-methyltransferase [bacterium]
MNTDNSTLKQGDFIKEYRNLEPGSFPVILADPPFNRFEEAGQEWDVKIDWDRMEGIFSSLLKPNGWVILFCDFLLAVELTNTFCHKLEFHGIHIWQKPGGTPSGSTQPLHDISHILLFRKKGVRVSEMTFNPLTVLPPKKPYIKRNSSADFSLRRQKKSPVNENKTGNRWVKTVIPQLPTLLQGPSRPNMTKEERANITHPSMKPLAVLQPLIRCYSNPGDLILDPFAGSGSTLVAALNEGRSAIGYEINEKFAKEAHERIKKYQMQYHELPIQGDLFETNLNA